jgi:cyclopropane fatty-acyl-phospholipid synthase-like methyltransferase
MTDIQHRLPTPEEVGEFYNRTNRLLTQFLGGNMHYGYWTGPQDRSGFEEAGARLTDIMIGKLGLGPDDLVLDLGCGPGKPAVQLARATGARVVGISVSTGDVELATARAAAEGLADRVRFQHADAMDLPFAPASFDAVLALESIVHIPDRTHVLRQIARVLKPGGRLALTDFVTLRDETEVDEGVQLALAEMLAAWRAAPLVRPADYPGFLTAAGLVVDEVTDITENTKYTFEKTYDAMRDYVVRNGPLPPDLARIYEMGIDVDWVEEAAQPQSEGVVLAVAHRPGTD